MRTIGLKPGDHVLLIERRGGRERIYDALVFWMGMNQLTAGSRGQMTIGVMYVPHPLGPAELLGIPHVSSSMWAGTTEGWAYEELPRRTGVCRFCGCTQWRACVDGNGDPCGWMDIDRTVCSSFHCLEHLAEEMPLDVELL